MARSQNLGAIIGLTIFIFLFIISTSLAVFFYIEWQEIVEENKRVTSEVEYLATGDERTQNKQLAMLLNNARDTSGSGEFSGKSVFWQMNTLNKRIQSYGTGSTDDTETEYIKTIQSSYSKVAPKIAEKIFGSADNEIPEKTPATQIIDHLVQMYIEADAELATVKGQYANAQANYARIEQKDAEMVTAIEEVNTKLTGEFKKLSDDRENASRQRQEALAAMETRVQEGDAEYQTTSNQMLSQIAELRQKNQVMHREILHLTSVIQNVERNIPKTVYEADGRVISMDTNRKNVVIDLGKDSRIMAGMTFEIFDQSRGVLVDVQNGKLQRGKATVEVIRINEDNALCRIVRQQFGVNVRSGDLIANLAYDKNKTYRFVIYGDFDLDGDGFPTPFDKERVKDMITRYGGELSETPAFDEDERKWNIDVMTDYIIVGLKPSRCSNKELEEAEEDDPWKAAQCRKRELAAEKYESLVNDARDLSVPALNQNRFLSLIGHYQN